MQRIWLCSILVFVAACPSQVEREREAAMADPDDPRVVRDGDDLYPKSALVKADEPLKQSPGTGRPDETNGVCRLFAPELPDPHCCDREFGFDADAVLKACGHKLYLGESVQGTCGYHFLARDDTAAWYRMTLAREATPQEAAQAQATFVRNKLRTPPIAVEPIPTIVGGYWMAHDNQRWAFLPGWDKVRRITWQEDVCDETKMVAALETIAAAKQPPAGAKRLGMVPKAR
jgi:hypothetical protein